MNSNHIVGFTNLNTFPYIFKSCNLGWHITCVVCLFYPSGKPYAPLQSYRGIILAQSCWDKGVGDSWRHHLGHM